MTHSQRLRNLASRTGLDGFADELRAIADEIDDQPAALPEPELGYIKTDKSNQPAYSARQMRAALQSQPAEVPDGVWEALQRLIENGEVMGPASREDAQLVAAYRDRVRFMAPPSLPAPQQTEREEHATARAFALATMAAEEFVRCNGLSTGEADEFLMTGPDLTDEHATACIEHLKHVGECVAFDCDDGVIVRLGDFTLGSLS